MTEALQSTTHYQRITTALIAVAFAGITYYFLGGIGIEIMCALIALAATYETLDMLLERGQNRRQKIYTSLLFTALFFTLVISKTTAWIVIFWPYILTVFFLGLAVFYSHRDGNLATHLKDAMTQSVAALYFPFLLFFVPEIHRLKGPVWFVLLLVSVWVGDIAAYYGGKTFGRHKLSPNLSPGKTWEGSICSLLFVMIVAIAVSAKFLPEIPLWKPAIIVGLSSIMGQLGDLIKSLVKRVAGVKDSGTLFPGHGGAFDRFDSLILASPFFYILVGFLT